MIFAARARRTCPTSLPLQASPVTPLFASLTAIVQIPENKTTLSPVFATLTRHVTPSSFICHSFKKHRGWGYPFSIRAPLRTHSNTSKPTSFNRLLHNSLDTPGVGSPYAQLPHSPSSAIIVGLTNAAILANARQRGNPPS